MVRIREIRKKILVLALIFAMICSVIPLQNVEATENGQEELQDIASEGENGEVSESVQQQNVLEPVIQYVYIENPYQIAPGVQKVAISFQEGLDFSNASLIYEKEGTGEQIEIAASEIEEAAALFSIEYSDETQAGIYHLVKTRVEVSDVPYEIDFNAVGINGRYGVNQECDTEPDVIVEEDIESTQSNYEDPEAAATYISVDEEGDLLENGSLEEAIEAATANVMMMSGRSVQSAATFANSEEGNIVVVLDPGHGGPDVGALGNGAREKDLTLKITKYCREELEKYSGLTVYMTRETDISVSGTSDASKDLTARVNLAKEKNADLFISFHLNSTGLGTAKGAEVYYPNSSYKPEIGSEGKNLAQKIQNELVALGLTNRGIKIRNSANGSTYADGSISDYYGLIWRCKEAGFPGLIIEHAFIDNADDYNKYLSSDSKLKILGQADARGILEYLGFGKGEWKSDGKGWKFEYSNGINPKSKWEFIEGYWYYFGADGYRLTGFQTIGDKKYYLNSDGKMAIGWLQLNDIWYYFNPSGAMLTGWQKINNKWYYLNDDGKMATGFQTIEGKKYLLDVKNGDMKTGWQKVDNKWYYFDTSGAMLTGWQTINGKRYYMDASGVMAADTWIGDYYVDASGAWVEGKKKPSQEGWIQSGDRWWYRHSDGGYTKLNWEKINGKWYYFDASGWMMTGWQTVKGKTYLLDTKNGDMKIGWQKVDNKWYYFDSSGAMQTGWKSISGKWYYMDASGVMAADTWIGDYYVDANGVWIVGKKKPTLEGWIQSGDRWWYRHSDGGYTKLNWEKINGKWYYFDASGWMMTGWQTVKGKTYLLDTKNGDMKIGWQKVDNKWYYFDSSGAMQTGWKWINNKCYYMDASGVMAADTWIGDYYVDVNGAWVQGKKKPLQEGWIQNGDRWWYRHSDGSYTKSGWEQINGKWYYFDELGWMKTGWIKPGSVYYYLEPSGAMHVGWLEEGSNKYYLNPQKNSYGAEGSMATGYREIDGQWYFFNKNRSPVGALYYTGVTPIMGASAIGSDENTVVTKMVNQFTKQGKPYPTEALTKGGAPDITTFCQIIYREAVAEGVRPEVVFAQAMLETGYLQFGGDVKVEQFNFSGLGAIGGGAAGNGFPDVETGIRAQVQHLKAYASDQPLNQTCVDVRFGYVTRKSAPYIEWLGIQENPAGKGWAGGAEYGFSMIKNYINPLLQ